MRFAGGSQWGLVSDIIPLFDQGLDEFSMNIENCIEWTEQQFNLGLFDSGLH